jgi:phosphatidylserine/phosphatidylglycerophosphate/cardiolipin synthase-like enzyme
VSKVSRAAQIRTLTPILLPQRAQGVLSLSSPHAKVFVIDDRRALVTSANATFSGMHRNRECGVEIRTRRDIKQLRDLIQSGFGTTPRPQLWTADDLAELREPVEALRSAIAPWIFAGATAMPHIHKISG